MSSPVPNIFSMPPPRLTLTQRMSSAMTSIPLPLMILTTIIVICIVIVYIVVKFKSGYMKSVNMLQDPVILSNPMAGDFMTCASAKLPASNNGTEYSYSMWLFVDNLNITADPKPVLYRGNSQSLSNGCFYVYMDAKTNKLYASAATNASVPVSSFADIQADKKTFLQSTIDYIPLQRWVNVLYSIKDTVMTTFLDGELYSVTSMFELPLRADGSRPLITPHTGDIMLGGKADMEGFNGYLGNCTYYNFGATISDVRGIYDKGPYTRTWFSYLGLGVRSPIYKIDTSNLK